MRRICLKIVIALMLLALPMSAFAALMTDEAVLGNDRWSVTSSGDLKPGTDNAYDIGSSTQQVADIYYNGLLIPGSSSGKRDLVESMATGDTLLATESGKIIIVTATTGTIKYVLPAATTSGINFTFIDGKSTGTNTFSVDPATTADTIRYLTFDGGDKATSPGATGDSISLVSDASNHWFIKSRSGTFTDGGA
jgi:hypothetical protein